jgi:hypothetical protein
MRLTGTIAAGIRLPIISPGDNLAEIVADSVIKAAEAENITIKSTDVIGITEAVAAKAENNFASIADIAADVREKTGGGSVGVVYPILSRNRFLNILKGIAAGAERVYVLLSYPHDEVGNPIMNPDAWDEVSDKLDNQMVTGRAFREITGAYSHPFTGMDYISLYENAGDNIHVYISNDPRDILKFTGCVIAAEIHHRFRTQGRLLKAGAERVFTLSDILNKPVNGRASGFNTLYGVLGSNLTGDDRLKLFPDQSGALVARVRDIFKERIGCMPEVLVYGDGAFKDPVCGIWELADPVVSPGYSERLGGQPSEMKLKFIADQVGKDLTGEEKQRAVADMIRNYDGNALYSEGTTPRKYADLLGSLCDLVSGSGDKGTPVVWLRGYFDNYSDN